MTDLRQAAQRALKAMEDGEYRADMIEFSDALIALRAALAEPEQPDTDCHLQGICQRSGYTIAPTPRKPLTNEELLAIYKDHIDDAGWGYERAIERAHGIGEQT